MYIVYSTRLAVSATVIVALKCFSLINKVISATNTKHIDGMKRDSQNEVLCLVRFITKRTLLGAACIEIFVTIKRFIDLFNCVVLTFNSPVARLIFSFLCSVTGSLN